MKHNFVDLAIQKKSSKKKIVARCSYDKNVERAEYARCKPLYIRIYTAGKRGESQSHVCLIYRTCTQQAPFSIHISFSLRRGRSLQLCALKLSKHTQSVLPERKILRYCCTLVLLWSSKDFKTRPPLCISVHIYEDESFVCLFLANSLKSLAILFSVCVAKNAWAQNSKKASNQNRVHGVWIESGAEHTKTAELTNVFFLFLSRLRLPLCVLHSFLLFLSIFFFFAYVSFSISPQLPYTLDPFYSSILTWRLCMSAKSLLFSPLFFGFYFLFQIFVYSEKNKTILEGSHLQYKVWMVFPRVIPVHFCR